MLNTGLVLEGGGMRAVYTAGVLDFFIEQDLYLNHIYAVSAGACQACSYLSKQHSRGYHTLVDYLDDKRYCSLHSLIKTGDLFGVEMCYDPIPLAKSIQDGNTKNVVILTQSEGYTKKTDSMMPLLKMKYRKYPQLVKSMETRHMKYNETLLSRK